MWRSGVEVRGSWADRRKVLEGLPELDLERDTIAAVREYRSKFDAKVDAGVTDQKNVAAAPAPQGDEGSGPEVRSDPLNGVPRGDSTTATMLSAFLEAATRESRRLAL